MPVMFIFLSYYSFMLLHMVDALIMLLHMVDALHMVSFLCLLPIAAPINFDRCVVGLPK